MYVSNLFIKLNMNVDCRTFNEIWIPRYLGENMTTPLISKQNI